MSRIANIFINVRDTLNDQDKDRWKDSTLLRLLNSGQKDIAKRTKLFRATHIIPLEQGKSTYELPEDLLLLRQVLYKNKPIDIKSTRDMDFLSNSAMGGHRQSIYSPTITSVSSNWRDAVTEEGELIYIIYDYDAERELRTYPIPFNDDLNTLWTFDNLYGFLDTLTGATIDTVYGVLNTFVSVDYPDTKTDDYGTIMDIAEVEALLVKYTQVPENVSSINDNPRLPEIYDEALQYWIAGRALRNDLDVQNRQFGAEELTFYAQELKDIATASENDNTVGRTHHTHYNGIG